MRKKLYAAAAFAVCVALLFGAAACGEKDKGPVTSPPPSEYGENVNVYGGTGDFVFSKWQAQSSSVYTEVTEGEDGSTFLRFVKSASQDSMSGVFAEVEKVADTFRYLNVTVSGTPGKTVMLRLGDAMASTMLLGEDKIVEVGAEPETFSYAISEDNAWMLGTIREVFLIADPGQNAASNVGTLTVHKTWFSQTLPENSNETKASPWTNGGNYKLTQFGDVTRVSYTAMTAGTWQNIFMDVDGHDPQTQNTLEFTLSNIGGETVYISVKTVETGGDDNSSLTWDNVVLEPGGGETLKIPLSKQIRRICMFVASADNVPSGSHSGQFEISEVTFSYTPPESLCAWQATSMFDVEKGDGKGTFTYTALPNGAWDHHIRAQVTHDAATQNTVTLTLTNKGEIAAHYFVKAEAADGGDIASTAFDLDAGAGRTVTLTVNSKVDRMVVWVNADAHPEGAEKAAAGSVELTNPVFSYTEPPVPCAWQGSNLFTPEEGDGKGAFTYTALPNGAWDQNIVVQVTHDAATQNTVTFTLTNKGETAAHYYVKAEAADGGEVSGDTFDLAAGESKTVVLHLSGQITAIVVWVNADAHPEGAESVTAGSVELTNPVFSYTEPAEPPV